MCCASMAQEYSVRYYDDSDGLSQWHATKVLQDKSGMIWLSTWNGLNRFDGVNFECFKVQPGDGNNVTNDRIRDFFLDDDGTFLCYMDDGVFRFDPRTCKYTTVTERVSKEVERMFTSKENVAWGRPHSVTYGNETLNYVRKDFTDRQGNVWYVAKEGIYKVTPRTMPYKYVDAVPHEKVRCIYRDNDGRIWVSVRSNDKGQVVVFDSKMNLLGYLGYDGRLHPSPVTFSDVFSIFQSKNDRIFIGAKPDGLYTIDAKDLFSGKGGMKHFFPDLQIYDIEQNAKGEIWLATFLRGVCRIDNPFSDNPKLWCLNEQKNLHYPAVCNKVRQLLFRGNIMIAATTVGLLVIDEKYNIHHHVREANRAESLSTSATTNVAFDKKGRLVVTTESGGVNILQSGDLLQPHFSFTHVTEASGLGTDVVYSSMIMNEGMLLQSHNELVMLSNDYEVKTCFGKSFWHANIRFSDVTPLILDDGRLLVGLEHGAMCIPLSKFKSGGYTPRIALTRIRLADGQIYKNADFIDTLRLSPDQRDIIVRYAAIDYSSEGNIRYATRILTDESQLHGNDVNWSFSSETRELSMSNLVPGTYYLQVRSTNAAGMWTDNVRTLTIIVEPRFSETTAAMVLGILLLIAIVSVVVYTIIYITNINRQRRETLKAYLALLDKSVAESNAPVEEKVQSKNNEIINPQMSAVDEAFMNRLVKYVECSLGNSDIGVDDIAAATAMSRSSLSRKMKQLLGVTPADFLKEARIKQAVRLLTTTDMHTSDIAYACGFSDPKYFSRCFKAITGKSPKDMRNSL